MMKQNLQIKIILCLVTIILFSSCSENVTYTEDAKLITLPEILIDPSLYTFKSEMNSYQPDTNIIKEIKNYFDAKKHKLYLYASFSCGCVAQQVDLAHICKVIENAAIPDSNYEIYNIQNSKSNHPYKTLFTLGEIPECVIMKDSNAVYFVVDTFRTNKLYGKIIPYEQLILNGLKK